MVGVVKACPSLLSDTEAAAKDFIAWGEPGHGPERSVGFMAREFYLKNPTPPGAAHATEMGSISNTVVY